MSGLQCPALTKAIIPVEIVSTPAHTVTNMLFLLFPHRLLFTSKRACDRGISFFRQLLKSVLDTTMNKAAGTPFPDTSAIMSAR